MLDRIQAGEAVPHEERNYAAELLVALAETYEGEHGLAYAGAALDIEPGNDCGIQLYAHYARVARPETETTSRHALQRVPRVESRRRDGERSARRARQRRLRAPAAAGAAGGDGGRLELVAGAQRRPASMRSKTASPAQDARPPRPLELGTTGA